MRHPTRLFWVAAAMLALIVAVVELRWNAADAQVSRQAGGSSSSEVVSSAGGPALRLSSASAPRAAQTLHARQDVALAVARECPAILLADGSLAVAATLSAVVPLTAVAVFDDAGTPAVYEDDVPLGLIEGDLDGDGVLDPGELWVFGGAFFAAPGAIGDAIYATGQDETGAVIQGYAGCASLPLPPEPPVVEEPAVVEEPPVVEEPAVVEEPPAEEEAESTATATTAPEPAAKTADSGFSAQAAADITPTVTKDAASTTVLAGDNIVFTLSVTNPGTVPDDDDLFVVDLMDILPDATGLEWQVTGQTGDGTCTLFPSSTPPELYCNLGELEAGETFSVQLTSPTTPDTCSFSPLFNEAELRWALESTDVEPTENITTDPVEVTVECPNLSVDKEPRFGTINAGDDATFDFTVSALEPTVFDVTLTDELPSGPVWSESESACTLSGNTFECFFADISSGAPVTVSVSGATDADDCGDLLNAVAVEGDTGGTGNGSFSAADADDPRTDSSIITVNCPDLRVEKTPDGGQISAGEDASFTIEVFNDGDGDAYSVDVTDTLPSGFSWTTAETACDIDNGNELSCFFEAIAAGNSESITVTADTTSATCGTLDNSVEVTANNEPSSDTGNNADTGSITVLCPDLAVTKTPDDGRVSAGENAEFTITVTNNGQGDAFDVEIEDDLPGDIAWAESSDACTIETESPVLLCSVDEIAGNGGAFSITVSGATDPADCIAALDNTASVSASNEPASAEDDNSDTGHIEVQCPNLLMQKVSAGNFSASDVISVGEHAEFNVVVQNHGLGLGTAFDVEVNDALPSQVVWTEREDELNACEIIGSPGSQVLTCSVDSLTSDESAEIVVRVGAATDGVPCGTVLENTAVTSASNEPAVNQDNNAATASITIACPELAITKSAGASPISAGDEASFTITVVNDGAAPATGVDLTDLLPDGIDWATGNAACAIVPGSGMNAQILECLDLTLQPSDGAGGGDDEFSVTVSGATSNANCGDFQNTASVTDEFSSEPIESNQATITVDCPDISVTKEASADTVNAGGIASFTIIVTNNGPGIATGVSVSDTLPDGDWAVTTEPSGLCTATATGTLACDLGALSEGVPVTITVSRATTVADCGTLDNSVEVAATNEDPAATSLNTDTASITVVCPDVSVEKTSDSPIVNSDEIVTYTIAVTNNGPGDAFDVNLTDDLPDVVAWTIDPAVDGCSIDGNGDLSCTFDELPDLTEITVTGAVPDNFCGELSNTASITAPGDTDPDNNSSGPVVIDVQCPDLLLTKDPVDAEVGAGETAAYTMTVSNLGPGTALDVTASDTLPDGIAWSESSPACSIDGDTLYCDFGDLAPTESAAVTISGITGPEDCGELSNTATADAANDDPVTTDPAVIAIGCPSVAMTKVADAGEVAAGAAIGFTLTVNNPQDANAFGVSVTDELPDVAGLAWEIDGGADAGDCAIDGGVLTCDFGTLPGGESRTVHIASPTTEESCGVVENSATVEADNEPADLDENNTDTASVAVDCASIALVKLATDGFGTEIATADVGDTITYLYLVANTGGVPLTDLSVLDDHFPVEGNLCPAGTTLAPDDGVAGSGPDEIVCAGDYLVGEIDITDADGLTLTNAATATGVTPLGDAVSASDDATVAIDEPKEPCEFPVTFTFGDDIPFVDENGDVLFTIPIGTTFSFAPGEVNEQGGCTMPFTVTDLAGNVLGAGTMSIYIQQSAAVGVRALVTDATLVVEVTEVTAWAVPGVPAPEPEVEEVQATIVVSGPVLEVETAEAQAVIIVEPELEVPFVQTETYTVSNPEVPNTGAGVTAPLPAGLSAFGGLITMLPALAAVTGWRRRALRS